MSKETLLSIGEASKLSGVSIKTIRYYSNIGLITPSFIDNKQYRHFSIQEICWLSSIRYLRQNHFSISDIKEFIASNSVDAFLSIYKKVRKNIKKELQSLMNADKKIQKMIQNLDNINNIDMTQLSDSSVKIKKIKERKIISIREKNTYHIVEIPKKVYRLFKLANEKNINIMTPPLAIFHESIENSQQEPIDHELGFCFYGKNNNAISEHVKVIPEGLYAVIHYKGGLANTVKAQKILYEFIAKNNFEIAGPFIKEFIFNNRQSKNLEETVSSLQVKFQ